MRRYETSLCDETALFYDKTAVTMSQCKQTPPKTLLALTYCTYTWYVNGSVRVVFYGRGKSKQPSSRHLYPVYKYIYSIHICAQEEEEEEEVVVVVVVGKRGTEEDKREVRKVKRSVKTSC